MVPTLDFHHSVKNEKPQSAFLLDHFSGHRILRRRSIHSMLVAVSLHLLCIRLAIYPVFFFTVARIHAAIFCSFIRRIQVLRDP